MSTKKRQVILISHQDPEIKKSTHIANYTNHTHLLTGERKKMRSRKPQRRELLKKAINDRRNAETPVKKTQQIKNTKDYMPSIDPEKVVQTKNMNETWQLSREWPSFFKSIRPNIPHPDGLKAKKFLRSEDEERYGNDETDTNTKAWSSINNVIEWSWTFECPYCGIHYTGPWLYSHGKYCKHPRGKEDMLFLKSAQSVAAGTGL
jgi:hypothetical protein